MGEVLLPFPMQDPCHPRRGGVSQGENGGLSTFDHVFVFKKTEFLFTIMHQDLHQNESIPASRH
ncbi:hypothetical protein ACUDCK_27675 [Achromobacter sp. CF-sbj1-Ac2-l]|uniref:hypothetical protein n=1 Tax=Achromobacter sp. CF-sbj1-Ac2-l TaxID=3444091 RepID=UPI004046A10C